MQDDDTIQNVTRGSRGNEFYYYLPVLLLSAYVLLSLSMASKGKELSNGLDLLLGLSCGFSFFVLYPVVVIRKGFTKWLLLLLPFAGANVIAYIVMLILPLRQRNQVHAD